MAKAKKEQVSNKEIVALSDNSFTSFSIYPKFK